MPAILIIGPSWVGDMVMAQSLFKTLAQQQPETRIDVLAPAWSKALLTRMPEVNDAIEMPLGHGNYNYDNVIGWVNHYEKNSTSR